MIDIFLDLDGVCLDFTSAALRVYGWSPAAIEALYNDWPKDVYWLHEILGVSKTQFFKAIDARGSLFWEEIQSYSWTPRLVSGLKNLGNVVYCTSPGLSPDSAHGKMVWLDRNHAGTNFVLTSQKHLLATPTAILIDDHREMCSSFKERGGKSFLMPQPWNGSLRATECDVDYLIVAVAAQIKALA